MRHIVTVFELTLLIYYVASGFRTLPRTGNLQKRNNLPISRRQTAVSSSSPFDRDFSGAMDFVTDFIESQREWYTLGDCQVLLPPEKVPRSIVHFVGGFLAGSAATVAYSAMLSCLAANGHVVVVTPIPAVDSNHGKVATEASLSFTNCYNQQLMPLLGSAGTYVPIFGLSHSLGGKLTVILNSRKQDRKRNPVRSGNIYLAFNNYGVKQDAELMAGKASPEIKKLLEDTPIVKDIFGKLFGPPGSPQQANRSVGGNKEQAPSTGSSISDLAQIFGEQLKEIVTKEVADKFAGELNNLDFVPSPEETWQMLLNGYNVQKNVLVKFKSDEIDQSVELSNYLRQRGCDAVLKVMPGNHLTPNTLTSGTREGTSDGEGLSFLKELTKTLNDMALDAWSDAEIARREKYRLPAPKAV